MYKSQLPQKETIDWTGESPGQIPDSFIKSPSVPHACPSHLYPHSPPLQNLSVHMLPPPSLEEKMEPSRVGAGGGREAAWTHLTASEQAVRVAVEESQWKERACCGSPDTSFCQWVSLLVSSIILVYLWPHLGWWSWAELLLSLVGCPELRGKKPFRGRLTARAGGRGQG